MLRAKFVELFSGGQVGSPVSTIPLSERKVIANRMPCDSDLTFDYQRRSECRD